MDVTFHGGTYVGACAHQWTRLSSIFLIDTHVKPFEGAAQDKTAFDMRPQYTFKTIINPHLLTRRLCPP